MKIVAFLIALGVFVPVVTAAILASRRMRSLVLVGLMLSPFFGTRLSINLMSMEWYRGPERGFEVSATDLAAVALAIACVARPKAATRWVPPGTLPLALFFGYAVLSGLGSPVPLATAFALFKALRCALVYWVVVNVVIQEASLETLAFTWTFIGWAIGAMALYQKYVLGLYRVPGPFDHSNTIPLYVNLILPALVVHALATKSQSLLLSWGQLGAALGMAFAVLATFSRAGMMLSAICVVGALAWVNLRLPSRRSVATAVCLACMGVIVGLKAAPSIVKRFQEAPEASAAAREEFNVAARMMADDYPLGVGPNAFSHVMTVGAKYREHLVAMADEEQAGVAHHIYWLTAAELGYAGLLLYVAVLASFLFRAARTALRSRRPESLLSGGLFLGCACLHASGFFEWALRIAPVTYQFTIVSALIVALECRLADAEAAAIKPAARSAP